MREWILFLPSVFIGILKNCTMSSDKGGRGQEGAALSTWNVKGTWEPPGRVRGLLCAARGTELCGFVYGALSRLPQAAGGGHGTRRGDPWRAGILVPHVRTAEGGPGDGRPHSVQGWRGKPVMGRAPSAQGAGSGESAATEGEVWARQEEAPLPAELPRPARCHEALKRGGGSQSPVHPRIAPLLTRAGRLRSDRSGGGDGHRTLREREMIRPKRSLTTHRLSPGSP